MFGEFDQHIIGNGHVFAMPTIHNVTGRWYDPVGREITEDQAREYVARASELRVGFDHDFVGDPWAFVITSYVPCDLLPARNKAEPPHIYVTAEGFTKRGLFRTPRMHVDYTQFAQNRTAAQAAHDQAITHVRMQVKRQRRFWRRLHIPWRAILILGALQWLINFIYIIVGAIRSHL